MRRELPSFSIVVPTYDRPRELARCLASLVRLDYPRDRFEVIVVDDGNPTPPGAAVDPFRADLDVTVLGQSHAGPAAARNRGAAQARGRFLAFTDDDCTPAPDWLRTLAARFAKAPDVAIGGRTRNAVPANPYSAASQLLVAYLYDYYNADPDRARFVASNNLAVPTDRFRAVGGFDPSPPRAAGEDREFCDRWLCHGSRLVYAPEVLVDHAHVLTFRTFCRQHFSYGRGAFYFRRLRGRRSAAGIELEPPSFYLDLPKYPFSRARPLQAPRLAALLLVSQAANAAGFAWERLVSRG
jgi:glycosyltransferase involved in cell wall biosynthesis